MHTFVLLMIAVSYGSVREYAVGPVPACVKRGPTAFQGPVADAALY